MTDEFARRLAATERRLHALETAPRAPLTDQVIAAQADIEAQQADIVAQQERLAETTQVLTFSPGSNDDSSASSGWQDWVTLGAVDVPSWATGVAVTVTMANALQLTVGPGLLILMRATLGGNTVDPAILVRPQTETSSSGDVTEAVWGGASSSLPAVGSRSVVVQTNTSIADRLRATTGTVFVASVTFL